MGGRQSSEISIPVQQISGEVTFLSAAAEMTIGDFKQLVIEALKGDVESRRVTTVELLLRERRLEDSTKLRELSEGVLVAVFGVRRERCGRVEQGGSRLDSR